jgi:Ca-activated chloride channel homolog
LNRQSLFLFLFAGGLCAALAGTVFRVDVGMVVVSFTVKDAQGNYVSGLRPEQICVREDNTVQRIESFLESKGETESMHSPDSPRIAGSVFVLFDTSNSMYEGFARSEDEIAKFIRNLDARQAVAVYSFSHNLTRLARLTTDHEQAIRGLRHALAGDSTAVLNATLLTLRDAALVPGRKAVVVFSNGPDDTSIVTPSDVARVAEEEGIAIYIVATKAHDEVCQSAFHLLSDSSGGRLFLADAASAQLAAFLAIGEDLKHTYTVTYYPEQNQNDGWRHIEVQVVGDAGRQYHVTARTGYWASRRAVDQPSTRAARLPGQPQAEPDHAENQQ